MRHIRIIHPKDSFPDIGSIDYLDDDLVFVRFQPGTWEMSMAELIRLAETMLARVKEIASE